MDPRKKSILTETEQNGLKKMKILNKSKKMSHLFYGIEFHSSFKYFVICVLCPAFLVKNEASEKVLDFMTKGGEDEALMLQYLIGRKNRPEHAWETV